jgi:hypothetical protein
MNRRAFFGVPALLLPAAAGAAEAAAAAAAAGTGSLAIVRGGRSFGPITAGDYTASVSIGDKVIVATTNSSMFLRSDGTWVRL